LTGADAWPNRAVAEGLDEAKVVFLAGVGAAE
jgi:hypothetical protein